MTQIIHSTCVDVRRLMSYVSDMSHTHLMSYMSDVRRLMSCVSDPRCSDPTIYDSLQTLSDTRLMSYVSDVRRLMSWVSDMWPERSLTCDADHTLYMCQMLHVLCLVCQRDKTSNI